MSGRRRTVRRAAGLAALVALAGCGIPTGLAVDSMVPILENTATAARERTDLTLVGAGFPGNLLLLDGLIRTEPENRDLLKLGSYLYFGYALGFVEPRDPARASEYYAQGRDYGLRALDRHGAFKKGRAGTVDDFQRGVAALERDDVPALAWAGANWGRWMSLNLDSPAAIADGPRVEALLDRLLALDPTFERGLPHALRGAYDGLRPEMFGGKPQAAKTHFDEARRISDGKMLLYDVFYAEFYCRQVLDEACFTSTLERVIAAPDTLLPDSGLLNAIGRERAHVLRDKQSEWF